MTTINSFVFVKVNCLQFRNNREIQFPFPMSTSHKRHQLEFIFSTQITMLPGILVAKLYRIVSTDHPTLGRKRVFKTQKDVKSRSQPWIARGEELHEDVWPSSMSHNWGIMTNKKKGIWLSQRWATLVDNICFRLKRASG